METNNYAAEIEHHLAVIAQYLDNPTRGFYPALDAVAALDACAALATITVRLRGAHGFDETSEAFRTGAILPRDYYRHLGEVLLRGIEAR